MSAELTAGEMDLWLSAVTLGERWLARPSWQCERQLRRVIKAAFKAPVPPPRETADMAFWRDFLVELRRMDVNAPAILAGRLAEAKERLAQLGESPQPYYLKD